jgi:hypothetical protein
MGGVFMLATCLAGCAPLVSDLKASRGQHVGAIHEQLSNAIQRNGFSHGIRIMREDEREIDVIFVSIPLDALKRQFISLHHMLFNVARISARPEFSRIDIQIELNASDEEDRKYMQGIVEPIVADARNVTVTAQRENTNDLVITMTYDPRRPGTASKSGIR